MKTCILAVWAALLFPLFAVAQGPVASVDTWKSPVLFIHGDDDRNVHFSQTVDLVARLRARSVTIEQLILPDEIHDFLLCRNWLAGYRAVSDFFDRQLKPQAASGAEPQ